MVQTDSDVSKQCKAQTLGNANPSGMAKRRDLDDGMIKLLNLDLEQSRHRCVEPKYSNLR